MYIWMNHEFTSFENPKKMVGQSTFPIMLLNGVNMNKNGLWTLF